MTWVLISFENKFEWMFCRSKTVETKINMLVAIATELLEWNFTNLMNGRKKISINNVICSLFRKQKMYLNEF